MYYLLPVLYCALYICARICIYVHMNRPARLLTPFVCRRPPQSQSQSSRRTSLPLYTHSLTYYIPTFLTVLSVCLSVCLPVVIVLLCLVSLCSLNLINTQPFIMRCALTACIYPTATPAFERKKREKCWLIYYVVYTYPGSAFHFAPSVGVYIILRP